jgi:hypothetical protein
MEREELEFLQAELSLAESMNKLLGNKDFKKIFIEGFMKEDMVQIGYNFTNIKPENRQLLVENLLARGIFKQYIDSIISAGLKAKSNIELNEGEN